MFGFYSAIFERFHGILHEGEIGKRVQYLIEGLFALRKAKFQGHPVVRPELDLVESEDQITHEVSLLDKIDPEIALDIFKLDPDFIENEKRYEELKKSLLGDDSEEEEDGDEDSDDDDDDEDESSEEEDEEQMRIRDETEKNLVNLRRTIYLSILPVTLQHGSAMSLALQLSCSDLVVAYPCALGLATPTAVLVGTSLGATKGLLLCGGSILEKFAAVNTVVFDKTGTLTIGKSVVTKILTTISDEVASVGCVLRGFSQSVVS